MAACRSASLRVVFLSRNSLIAVANAFRILISRVGVGTWFAQWT